MESALDLFSKRANCNPRQEEVRVEQLNNGDQIAVERHCSDLSRVLCPTMGHTGGKYFHHGIFDGKRSEVIEFYGETNDKSNARVITRLIGEFAPEGHKLYRVVHKKCLPVEKTMEMAKRALKAKKLPAYNLLFFNCETFATWLKTGCPCSKQVSDAIEWNLSLFFLVVAVFIVFAIVIFRLLRRNKP